jgi:hypothetical protein
VVASAARQQYSLENHGAAILQNYRSIRFHTHRLNVGGFDWGDAGWKRICDIRAQQHPRQTGNE